MGGGREPVSRAKPKETPGPRFSGPRIGEPSPPPRADNLDRRQPSRRSALWETGLGAVAEPVKYAIEAASTRSRHAVGAIAR